MCIFVMFFFSFFEVNAKVMIILSNAYLRVLRLFTVASRILKNNGNLYTQDL